MYFGADGALVATSNTIKCTQLDGTRNMSSCRGACGAWGCRFTAPYLLNPASQGRRLPRQTDGVSVRGVYLLSRQRPDRSYPPNR